MPAPENTVQPPAILDVLPLPIVLDLSGFTIDGSGFQPGLTIALCNQHDQLIATLHGDQLDQFKPNSVAVTYDFEETGNYTLRVINPDGGQSERFPVTVASL